MSWLSKAVGKIPVVGHALNEVGKVLPSVGQIVGGAALGPAGAIIGGKADPHTTATQTGIGNAVAGTAAALGAGKLAAGALPVAGAAGGGGTDGGDIPGNDDPSSDNGGGNSITDFVKNHGGDIVSAITDFAKKNGTTALEAYNIYQAAQNAGKSQQYAQDAIKGTTDAYNAKAPLRALGIAGLQNPGANVPDLSNIRQLSTAGSGNPFAKALPVAGAATGFKPGVAPGVTPTGTQGALPLALGPVAQGQPAVPSFTSPGSPYANPKKSVLPVAS